MRIIAFKTIREFFENHPDSEQQLKAWYQRVKKATWKTPIDVKRFHKSASIVGKNRVVFNIKGNDYRLVVKIEYQFGVVYIKFIGTHNEYDKIDVTTI